MPSPLISVVIPTLHPQRWLPACLQSLSVQSISPLDFEIVVVDNSGGQAAPIADSARSGNIRVLANAVNQGVTATFNQGIQATRTPFVALLNDDTTVSPRWLQSLIEAMQPHDVGSCASLMVFDEQPHKVQSAGIAIDRAVIAWDRLGGHPVSEAQQSCEVFGASGGAALYRREMLDQIGLFDARYYAYLEDVDLAWRAQRAHWRCMFVPAALVRHKTSATSGANSPFKNRLLGRNKIWLAAKNACYRDFPVVILYDLLAVLWAGASRKDWSHLQGRWDALAGLGQRLRERQGQTATSTAHFDPLIAPWRVPARMGIRSA